MDKSVSMSEPVFGLVSRHPEALEIMLELGFQDIAKPGMLQTAGRFMTLSKGCKLKKIAPDAVKEAFQRHGFRMTE